MDSASTNELATQIEEAYRRAVGVVTNSLFGGLNPHCEIAVSTGAPGDLFVGCDLGPETETVESDDVLVLLARVLRDARRRVEEVDAVPLDIHGDPFAPGFFEREPDAWLVCGGGEKAVEVGSEAERDAEIERRRRCLRAPLRAGRRRANKGLRDRL